MAPSAGAHPAARHSCARRIEHRRAGPSGDIARLAARHARPGLEAVGRITARRGIVGGRTSTETRHHLLSTVLGPARFNRVVRRHRDIENGLHRVPDVVLNEDRARHRKDHGPENPALLRRLALNLARLEPTQGSLRGTLERAGRDDAFLAQLLAPLAQPQMRWPWPATAPILPAAGAASRVSLHPGAEQHGKERDARPEASRGPKGGRLERADARSVALSHRGGDSTGVGAA